MIDHCLSQISVKVSESVIYNSNEHHLEIEKSILLPQVTMPGPDPVYWQKLKLGFLRDHLPMKID